MSLMKVMQVRAPGADFELVRKDIPEPQANARPAQSRSLRGVPW